MKMYVRLDAVDLCDPPRMLLNDLPELLHPDPAGGADVEDDAECLREEGTDGRGEDGFGGGAEPSEEVFEPGVAEQGPGG
jgi:hypothetical protein